MSELWSKAQIDSMTQAQQVMLRVGGYKTLRLGNLSGYTCTIASQKGYSTSNYDQGMLAQIPPWTVMPLDVTAWPSQVFVTLDPALFPLPTANTDLTDREVVSADLSVLYLANMSPNTLLSRTTTDITAGSIDANITNAVVSVQTPAGESLPVTLPAGTQVEITNATLDVTASTALPVEFGSAQDVTIVNAPDVTVNNTTSGPVNNAAVPGVPFTAYETIVSTNMTTIVTVNATIHKLYVTLLWPNNLTSSTSTGMLVYLDSTLLGFVPGEALTYNQFSYTVGFDLDPGIYVGSVRGIYVPGSSTNASSLYAIAFVVG